MIVGVIPSSEQVRYYAASALNGFDTLDPETAIANARSELSAMLEYLAALSAAKHTIPVLGLRIINGCAGLEPIGGDLQINDTADLKVVG